MLNPSAIYSQIQQLTVELIETGLCEAQNFPSIVSSPGNVKEVGITHADNSLFLKNISYSEMHRELSKNRFYNIKLIDGALLSMLYRFKDEKLLAHRLAYFPSPDLEAFQNEPELYLEDEVYIDVLDRRIVTVPLRFDYDSSKETSKPIIHPKSHLTIGQYKNCRIPVSAPLTPYQFVSFIMLNFYHTAQQKFEKKFTVFKESFERSIFDEEVELLHVCTPYYK